MPNAKPKRGRPIQFLANNKKKAKKPKPLTEGQVRCPVCERGVRQREDGTLIGHSSINRIPCIGGTPRITTLVKGKNTPTPVASIRMCPVHGEFRKTKLMYQCGCTVEDP